MPSQTELTQINLNAALNLIRIGISIFPAKPNKVPFIKGWKNGSLNEAEIQSWWQQYPNAMPAIPCGINKILVVDCDVKNGTNGNLAWDNYCNGLDILHQEAVIVNTPSGGRHFYYKQTDIELLGNTAGKIAAAIDTRGNGGYVIAPGATLIDGKSYQIVYGSLEMLPDIPFALNSFLKKPKLSIDQPNITTKPTGIEINLSERKYAQKALKNEAYNVTNASEGERNNTLNKAAFSLGTLLSSNGITEVEIENTLSSAAIQSGLPEPEIRNTIKSGMETGKGRPRPSISQRINLVNGLIVTSGINKKFGLIKTRVSDVTPEHISWLWQNRIALGKVTIIAGDPGLGKSQLTTYLAARVSTATSWPNNDGKAPLGSVVMFSCEDDIADTIRPRLEAAGANMNKVYVVNERLNENGALTSISLNSHMQEIEQLAVEDPDIRLIVIDPITAYLDKIDSHKTSDVRSALAPLQSLASKYGIAVVLISHFNKGSGGGKAINAVTGSGAFVAASRAAFIVTKGESKDDGLRLFLEGKNNLAKAKGLSFRIKHRVLPSNIDAPYLEFEDGELDITADEALAPNNNSRKPTQLNIAEHFLRVELSEGSVLSKELLKKAEEQGITEKTLRRAQKEMGITATKDGYQGQWIWSFPFDAKSLFKKPEAPAPLKMDTKNKDTPPKNMGTFNDGWPS